MAKLKLKKMPKAPKALRKPSASASLTTKERYIERVKEQKKNYAEKCKAVEKENAKRVAANKKSEQLSKVISGMNSKPSYKR